MATRLGRRQFLNLATIGHRRVIVRYALTGAYSVDRFTASFHSRFRIDLMSVTIRLTRGGAKKFPSIGSLPPIGAAPAMVGSSSNWVSTTRCETPEVRIDQDRLRHWISVGAVPSQTVGELIRDLRHAAPPVPPPLK